MNSSILFDSSADSSSISRNVEMWRSGITSRWTSASGLMSCSAAKPSAFATWSPSRARRQKRQLSGSEDPSFRDGCAADADELADRRVDEPRRIVVTVAAAGAVDEDDVVAADLAAPALETCVVRSLTEPRASFALHGRRHRIVSRRTCPRPRRVRKDVHLRRTRGGDDVEGVAKRALVLGRKADDHVGREVELLAERNDAEVAGEAAAVLDLHERADAIEPPLALDACDRSDVSGDHSRRVLAPARDHVDVRRQPGERVGGEIRSATRDIDAAVRAC